MLDIEHHQVVGLFFQRRFGGGVCLLQRRQEMCPRRGNLLAAGGWFDRNERESLSRAILNRARGTGCNRRRRSAPGTLSIHRVAVCREFQSLKWVGTWFRRKIAFVRSNARSDRLPECSQIV